MSRCGLYIHIPFCKSKCNYCDFYSLCGSESVKTEFINTLMADINFYGEKYKDKEFDTLFVGGGTPTVLGVRLGEIIGNTLNRFNFLPDSEITVEANPESLSIETARSLALSGVNRVSMGAQTFNEEQLRIIGRIHSVKDVYDAVNNLLINGITNYNIDLMFGLPVLDEKQDALEIWNKTLTEAFGLKPKHLSAYSLTLEENTPLYKNKDKLCFPNEDTEELMYSVLCENAKRAGFEHYEISNYSLPGFECRHNLKYWEHKEYLGIGPSSHSYIDSQRSKVTGSVEDYINGLAITDIYENINDTESIYEELITGLRLKKGIELSRFKKLYNINEIEKLCNQLVKLNYVMLNNGILSLTEKGFRISNSIIYEIDKLRLR